MTSGVASHADVLRGSSRVPGTRDEPLRTSARKAEGLLREIRMSQ